MFRKDLALIAIMVVALTFTSAFAGIDQIAIFNENVGWTTVAAAKEATDQIVASVKSAKSVKVLNKAGIADFIKSTHDDGTVDAVILFGYLPETVYTPGNSQKDDSLIEQFIVGGNIVLNAADYIFYVTLGGGKNGADGLKTITNSAFDCWGDGNVCKPTADGKKYVPSLLAEYPAQRPMKLEQVKADENWEVEVAFGSSADGKLLDPAVIKSTTHGGRFVVVRQTPAAAPDRGKVFSEIIDNFFGPTVAPVDPVAKIATAWGNIKRDNTK